MYYPATGVSPLLCRPVTILRILVLSLLSLPCFTSLFAQTNSFPLYSSGAYSGGGSGDNTSVSNAQLKLQSSSGYIRVPHVSADANVSVVYNFETGKNIYWGESTDAGNCFFRGRNLIVNDGNVGIGTTSPQAKLEVDGNILLLTAPNQIYLNGGTTVDPSRAGFRDNAGDIVFNSHNNGKLFLNRDVNSDTWIESSPDGINNIEIATFKSNGNVGIGTTTPKAKLAVNGNILAQQVTVSLSNLPDYVFDRQYRLRPLQTLEKYIRQNKHLPGIPSADSVQKNGLDLGANQAVLLKKIEELTLYVIEQDKKLQEQDQKIRRQEEEKKSMKERVSRLERSMANKK